MNTSMTDAGTLEREIRAELARSPGNAGLHAALGGLRLSAGYVEDAVGYLEKAATLAPSNPAILGDFGAALTAAGRFSDAERILQSGLRMDPASENLLFNLARCLHLDRQDQRALEALVVIRQRSDDVLKLEGDVRKDLGDKAGALRCYLDALQQAPNNAAYINDLGVLIETTDDPTSHVVMWRRLSELPGAHAVIFFFLGNALHAAGDLAGARAAFEEAVRREPSLAHAYNNLSLVLGKLGLENESRMALEKALAADPGLAAARSNLGSILLRGSALDEAELMLREAVRLDPQSADVQANLGAVLMRQHKFDEAERVYRHTLAARPGFPAAELNLGLLLLTTGRLEEGWPYYESRWKLKDGRPALQTPQWRGEPLDGKTLFVFAEQGFGDNIQFIRYLLLLKGRYPTMRAVYYSGEHLHALFRNSPIAASCDILLSGDPVPPHDFQSPIMSLPWRCGTTLANIPDPGIYLAAVPAAVDTWRARLAEIGRPRVGLVWATSETFVYRSAKTVALDVLASLFEVAGIEWVNLQFGKPAEEIVENGLQARIFDPMGQVRNFSDTAAIIANLDLVIGVDTAVIHLAAAMGRPAWMLDRFDTDWRWLPPREDSPWYRTLRIFRQSHFGEWDPVVDRVCAALTDWQEGIRE